MKKGFTLIELLVVTAIIVFLTALILPNYRVGDKQLALQRSANKLAQDMRRTQEMAMNSKEFSGAPATFKGSYGIYLNKSQPTQYILFADLDDDKRYDANEKVETLQLENKVKIEELVPGSPLTIVFVPPDPTIIFFPDSAVVSISIKAEGLETTESSYTYEYSGSNPSGQLSPRADCDTSQNTIDCPTSFSALASDPDVRYDRYRVGGNRYSRKYQKTETVISVPLQKIIQVNKAGLIAIE